MKRNNTIDIIKGIAILCMVAGHAYFPFRNFVYLFHMAVFFIASGYFYKASSSEDIPSTLNFIKRKIVSLWFVYFIWTAIFSILHNFFIRINFYTDNPLIKQAINVYPVRPTEFWSFKQIFINILKSSLFRGGAELLGGFWFIAALFELSVMYVLIDFCIKKLTHNRNTLKIHSIISFVFLMFGYLLARLHIDLFGLARVFSFYILFHGGYILNKYKISDKKRPEYIHFCFLFVSLVILLICNSRYQIELAANRYPNPAIFLLVSFAGWELLYELSFYLQKLSFLSKILTYVGQNTMSILALHLLAFKIVSIIGVVCMHKPLYLIASFPILFENGLWWIAYTIIGSCVPLLINEFWKLIKVRVKYITRM